MIEFTTIKPNHAHWYVERQQDRLGMTDRDRAKKREQIKRRNKEKEG